jgi:hypothetical protein
VIHTSGDCPVGCGELVFVVPRSGTGGVLVWCPTCGGVWPSQRFAEIDDGRTLADYGLSPRTVRYADEAEIAASGQPIAASHPEP